jgi:hypothetical protein
MCACLLIDKLDLIKGRLHMPATQSLREKSNFLQSSLLQDKEATFLPAPEKHAGAFA